MNIISQKILVFNKVYLFECFFYGLIVRKILFFLYSSGVTPLFFQNTLIKQLMVEKPDWSATSLIALSEFFNKLSACDKQYSKK